MVDGGACTHPVGPCPSDSAGAQLGSLNAAAATTDAGGGSGRVLAMVDGGACTHPVGACPSDSAGAQLGPGDCP